MNPIASNSLNFGDLLSNQRLERIEQRAPTQNTEDEKLLDAANEFEVLLVQQMMKSMRSSGFESGLVDKSEGEKVFQSMLDEQYARISTLSNGMGMGEMIYKEYRSNLKK
jgi:flagellar protein FlgJ